MNDKLNTSIFIDTDMGNDDIMALCMLLLIPRITIVGISTVNGVSRVKIGTNNLARILNYLNKSIPVFQGNNKVQHSTGSFPIRDIQRAENLTLLKPLIPPPVKITLSRSKTLEEFMFESCTSGITILALGPLTNIAKTIDVFGNSFIKNISRIVLMGGGIEKGNVPPLYKAEYNIWLDPISAQKVFSSGIPITMIGIDATSKVPTTEAFKKLIKRTKPSTSEGSIIQQLILNNDSDFDAFYDPLAIAILLEPRLITQQILTSIEVVLKGQNKGKTIVKDISKKNVQCVMNVNSNRFYDLVLNLLKGGEIL